MRNLLILILITTFMSCGKHVEKKQSTAPTSIVSKSICSDSDTRRLSYDPRVARALGGGGVCTVTMISRNCGISAGHCVNALDLLEFNTGPSQNGRIVNVDVEDTFRVDKGTIVSRNNGIGDDWAVFKVNPSSFDYRPAGDVQGYYGINSPLVRSTFLRIVGYGVDTEPTHHLAQQRGYGYLVKTDGSQLFHNVDTMGGNSGSAIVDNITGRVIGIHSHGGCGSTGTNGGTLIAMNIGLQRAISACVKGDL